MSDVTNTLSSGTPPAGIQSLLGSLLGPKLGPVSDFIAGHSGVKSGSAMSLLGMAAPLLMGILSKHVSSQGLGAGGLGQLLSSQIPYVKDAIPPGLASTLGINNLLSGKQKVATSAAEPTYRQAAPAGGGILKWAWVPILLALLGWFFASRTHRAPEIGATVETNANLTATGRGYGNIDFSSLNLAPGGMADNLAKAISSGDWNKTVELQGVTDTAGAVTDSAKAGIGEIGRVLSAAPNVKVQITGHGATDEAGLSQANSIKSALISTGISEDRISTTSQAGSGVPTINLVH